MKRKLVTIWTIGHSNRSAAELIEMLKAHEIRLLADVRRFPGSRRLPHFNREPLSADLGSVGIGYEHFPELGGRRRALPNSLNTAWRHEAFRGYADHMASEEFRSGMERLLRVVAEQRAAILCAEALWWQCHRGLIADWLKARGHTVLHIVSRTKAEEHPFTSAARLVNGELSYVAVETAPLFPS